jgi:hypothetical protein
MALAYIPSNCLLLLAASVLACACILPEVSSSTGNVQSSELDEPPGQVQSTVEEPAAVVEGEAMARAPVPMSSGVQSDSDKPAAPAQAPALGQAGAACQRSNECESQSCVDNVCCISAQCGECQFCDASGQCADVPVGERDDTCNEPDRACDGAAHCALANGEMCTTSENACASGHCELTSIFDERPICCAETCGECTLCAQDGASCAQVTFGDDALSCNGKRTCSGGVCRTIDVDRMRGKEYVLQQVVELVQTFTARAGTLVEIRMRSISCGSLASLQGVKADGMPNGVVIAKPQHRYEERESWVFEGIPLMDGQKLAFVLERFSCSVGVTSGADTYTGGQLFVQNSENVWQEQSGSLAFMTIVLD